MARGANTRRADASNVELVALGQQVYRAQCASCHGVNLEGQPNWQQELASGGHPAPPHDASGHTWHHPDALLFDIVKRGGQASSSANYKSTWSADIRAAQEQVTSQTQ